MIELRRWNDADLPLLERTVGDAAVMAHLGGAETPEKIRSRHEAYRDWSGDGGMMTIWIPTEKQAVGNIGFWESAWAGDDIFEVGWTVLPQFGRRGIATEAAREIIARVRELRKRRFLFAFPAVDNVASNRVCERAGFTNLGACEIEYPTDHLMHAHAWRVDLIWGKA